MTGLLAEMKGLYIVDEGSEGHGALAPVGIRCATINTREAAMKLTMKSRSSSSRWFSLIVLYSSSLYTLGRGDAGRCRAVRPAGWGTVTEAGLHMKLPFVQEVLRFEKRLLYWDGDPNQIPTKGREFIWVDTTARWRISDAKKFLENVASEEGAQSRLNDILDSVVRDQVSSSELVELVRSASWKFPMTTC
jgi:membrane protease subunit HflC